MAALLPVLLCGGVLLVCFFMMSRMHGGGSNEPNGSRYSSDITTLREEVDRLRASAAPGVEQSRAASGHDQNEDATGR